MVWTSPTWEVYERWCFVKIAKELKERYFDYHWNLQTNRRNADIVLSGQNGDREITLYFQPRFPAFDQKGKSRFVSISQLRIPDIVLTIQNKTDNRFIVFDAKYRTSRQNVLDAMSSAHIYHDSLRWDERRPDAALLVVPTSDFIPWLKDEKFRRRESVGIIAIVPGQPAESFGLSDYL